MPCRRYGCVWRECLRWLVSAWSKQQTLCPSLGTLKQRIPELYCYTRQRCFNQNGSWLRVCAALKLMFSLVIKWTLAKCEVPEVRLHGQMVWVGAGGADHHVFLGAGDVLGGQLEEQRALFKKSWVFAELFTCSLKRKHWAQLSQMLE